jgi:hypothetical protein
VACVTCPDDPDFERLFQEAYEAIAQVALLTSFSAEEASHSRGDFPQVTAGIAYGMGRTKAMNIKTSDHKGLIEELLANPPHYLPCLLCQR